MDFASTIPISASTNVFETGNYITKSIKIEPQNCKRNGSNQPPRPLLICTPSETGDFPVVLFLHGYLLYNSFYSQLLHHIASHGFIVVAPQVNFNLLLIFKYEIIIFLNWFYVLGLSFS